MTKRKPIEDHKPTGRPTDYRPEYAQRMIDYFGIRYDEVTSESGRVDRVYRPFPTLAGFAGSLRVCRDTLYHWSTQKGEDGKLKYPEFSYAYKLSKELQEADLVEGTLSGRYQPSFAIFASKNILGWRDKVETEHTGKDGGPIQTEATVLLSPSEAYLAMLKAK